MGKLLEFFRPKRDDDPMSLEEVERFLEWAGSPLEAMPENMESCVRVMETATPSDTDVLYVIETDGEFRFHKPKAVRTVRGGAHVFKTVCGKEYLDRSQYPLELVRSLEPLKVAPIGDTPSTEAPLYVCGKCLPSNFMVPLIRLIDRRLVAMVEPTPARLADLGMTPINDGREWVNA